MNRRVFVAGMALVALVTMLAGLPGGLTAQGKVVKIGLSLPLTGADADGADAILKGAQMAINEINGKDLRTCWRQSGLLLGEQRSDVGVQQIGTDLQQSALTFVARAGRRATSSRPSSSTAPLRRPVNTTRRRQPPTTRSSSRTLWCWRPSDRI